MTTEDLLTMIAHTNESARCSQDPATLHALTTKIERVLDCETVRSRDTAESCARPGSATIGNGISSPTCRAMHEVFKNEKKKKSLYATAGGTDSNGTGKTMHACSSAPAQRCARRVPTHQKRRYISLWVRRNAPGIPCIKGPFVHDAELEEGSK